MNDRPVPTSRSTSGRSRFDERLSVPLWWYVPAIGVAAVLGVEIHMDFPNVPSWIGAAICAPVAVLVLVVLGRTRVRVVDDMLDVGRAKKELRHFGRAEIVPKADRQRVLGPELDPAALLMVRAWVRQIVRVEITDPDDPTPYWVFSVRDAPGLIAALKS